MNEFDRVFVEESIKARLGPVRTIDLCCRANITPMTMFIDVAEQNVPHLIDLFWVDEGLPVHFTLGNESSSPVIFHSRQLELSGLLRSLYTTQALDQLREDLAFRVCLRMIAEFLLAAGYIDQSLQCLAKSRLDCGVFMQEPSLMELEHLPIDERYLCIWFFGLGHEIGHCIRNDARETIFSVDRLSLHWIEQVVDTLIDLYTKDIEARSKLRSIISNDNKRADPDCYASSRRVREEAVCDVFSLLTMFRAATLILPMVNRVPCPTELLQETQIAFAALMMIEQCRILASLFDGGNKELENQNFVMSNIAINARSNILRHVLCDRDAHISLEQIVGDGIELLHWLDSSQIDRCAQFVAVQSVPIHNGLNKARLFLSSTEMRDPEIFYSYATEISGSPAHRIEAASFVKNARLLGRSTPELDHMALLAGPF